MMKILAYVAAGIIAIPLLALAVWFAIILLSAMSVGH